MCNSACINFIIDNLNDFTITGKDIIEVGSYNVNGSVSFKIKERNPRRYLGVDISNGPCVDQICDVGNLISTFGKNSFDCVITTEMLEHVEDWRAAIRNLKGICKPNGHIFITTRSFGFPLHGYPKDYWRFEVSDMQNIFSDSEIISVQKDTNDIGVFVHAIKKENVETDLNDIQLYNMIHLKRI
jgi:SAM-dependent methyltransferase